MECYDLELSPPFEKVTVNIQSVSYTHLDVYKRQDFISDFFEN